MCTYCIEYLIILYTGLTPATYKTENIYMSKVIIKNVECYGNIQDADCILVSSCDDSFSISPNKNWTETLDNLLNNDNYMQKLAKNGELQLEVV